jgi:hypothetical protein
MHRLTVTNLILIRKTLFHSSQISTLGSVSSYSTDREASKLAASIQQHRFIYANSYKLHKKFFLMCRTTTVKLQNDSVSFSYQKNVS